MPAKREFFKLRELVTGDIEECVVFYRQMIEHHRAIYQDDNIPYEEEQKKHMKEKLERTDDNYIKMLAEREKQIVGLLTLEIKGRTCEIDEILVDKDMRGRGIGQAFAKFVQKTAFERKCSEVQVSFAARNLQALRFYHTMGLNCLGMIQIFMPLTERGKEQWYKKGKKTRFLGLDCYY